MNRDITKIRTFKLIVAPTDNCLKLCRYLVANITKINKLGVRVRIEKADLDQQTAESMRRQGITRLPTMISPDGKHYVGIKNIIDLFEKNIRVARDTHRFGPGNSEIGGNPDMAEYWSRELYSGTDNRGYNIPRDDPDEPENENTEIERRMAMYRQNIPRHRGGSTAAPNDTYIDMRGGPAPDTHGNDIPPLPDNIAEPATDFSHSSLILPSTGDPSGDDMDRRMLDAWMSNIEQ